MPTPSKGVRNLQRRRTIAATADRQRGLTWGQLALKYKVDRNNLRHTVLRGVRNVESSPRLYAAHLCPLRT